MNKKDLALSDQQWLMGYKTKPNQMAQSDFLCGLMLDKVLMQETNNLSKAIQNSQTSAIETVMVFR